MYLRYILHILRKYEKIKKVSGQSFEFIFKDLNISCEGVTFVIKAL